MGIKGEGLTEEGLTDVELTETEANRIGANMGIPAEGLTVHGGPWIEHHCSVDVAWRGGKVATSAGNTSCSLSSSGILSAG